MSSLILGLLAAIFLSVAVITATTMSYVLSSMSTERKRLKEATRTEPRRTVLPEIINLTGTQSGIWTQIEALVPRSKKDMNRLRLRLIRAGWRHPAAPTL